MEKLARNALDSYCKHKLCIPGPEVRKVENQQVDHWTCLEQCMAPAIQPVTKSLEFIL